MVVLGKTSLIKALTGDESLEPKDNLFATLDVTVHAGTLPSRLRVLFVDTVGFISDIPTQLVESFTATLEDAMVAVCMFCAHLCFFRFSVKFKSNVKSVISASGCHCSCTRYKSSRC